MEKKPVRIPNVKVGETFEVGGIEFIRFPEKDGMVPAVAKNVLFRCAFGKDNNFAQSNVLKRMEKEVLPKLIEAVGEEALCAVRTDLTTLDGLKTYGTVESLVSLLTLDFYREHVEIFDLHKVDAWWWLATADSAEPHKTDWPWVVCVAPSGVIGGDYYIGVIRGVRPFCIFQSSIFESFEE